MARTRSWIQDEKSNLDRVKNKEQLKEREYILPVDKLKKRTKVCTDYLAKRGVGVETQDLFQVCSDKNGNIAFPALEKTKEGVVRAMTKFRVPRDVAKGEKIMKSWKDSPVNEEQIGKPVLVGTHLLDAEKKQLFVLEGEIKAMVAYQAIGYNCASVPFGANAHDWIDNQWELLKDFDEVIVCADNDAGGAYMIDEILSRIGAKVKIAKLPEAYNDITDLHDREGVEAVRKVLKSAEYPDSTSIIQVSKHERKAEPEHVKQNAIATTWGELDRELGSLKPGHVTLVGGYTGQGKTKLVQNLFVAAMKKSIRALYGSFEETVEEIIDSVENIISGPLYLGESTEADTDKKIYTARQDIRPFMQKWYDEYFYVFSGERVDVDDYFDIMEIAVRRHGIKFFIIDNLMSLCGVKRNQFDLIQEQAYIARLAHDFAQHFAVHIILVSHNNQKGEFANVNTKPTIDSFKGSTEVTFWVQNALQLWRVPESIKDQIRNNKKSDAAMQSFIDADHTLSICKARGGAKWIDVFLAFDYKSMRFAPLADRRSLNKEWGWEKNLPQDKYRGEPNFRLGAAPAPVQIADMPSSIYVNNPEDAIDDFMSNTFSN